MIVLREFLNISIYQETTWVCNYLPPKVNVETEGDQMIEWREQESSGIPWQTQERLAMVWV